MPKTPFNMFNMFFPRFNMFVNMFLMCMSICLLEQSSKKRKTYQLMYLFATFWLWEKLGHDTNLTKLLHKLDTKLQKPHIHIIKHRDKFEVLKNQNFLADID